MAKTDQPHAFAAERRAAILSMLERSASVQVAELARAFGVSAVTVRGDLDALEADGKLRRTHGGAVSLNRSLTVSVQDRRINVNVAAKRAIAQAALEMVRDGDVLLLDSGTTALELVRMLDARRDVTVITADLSIADYIDESLPGVNAVMLGGTLRKGHRYLCGPLVTRSLEVLHADTAFLCPTSFVPGRGFMTNFEQMAEVKAAFLKAASARVALIDAAKVEAPGIMRFAALEEMDAVVMDADPAGVVAAAIEAVPEGAPRPQLVLG